MKGILIREPGQVEARQLAELLCTDDVLRDELGFAADARPTMEDILGTLAEWCPPRRATTYVILADNVVIGSISLSRPGPDGLSAKIGYWIGSAHRRLGYCRRAFAAVLDQAASEGIDVVSSTIAFNNIPSRRIWERHGAVASEASPGWLQYKLKIEPPATGAVTDSMD